MTARTSPRLGAYRKTPAGYPAFHIETGPLAMPVKVGDRLLGELDRATLAVGKLVGTASVLPSPENFISMYMRLEAVISSRIEGTRASLVDLLRFEQEPEETERLDDLTQVSNHLKLLQILDTRKRSAPLTLGELEAAHRTLLKGTVGVHSLGKIRTVQNWIGPPGPISMADFIPPPPGEVKEALRDLVAFINHNSRLPPIIRAAVAHVYFETIHPFADGNGRIGRYLIHFMLWKCGVVDRPILYFSHYIRRFQGEYYERLNGARDPEGLEEFCIFLTTGIGDVAEEALGRSREVVAVCRDYERVVRGTMGRRTVPALRVLEELYRQPIAEVPEIARWSGLGRSSTNLLVDALLDAKILVERTGQARNRVFGLKKYLDLFTAVDEEA
jgi:Fic family protein